MAVFWGHYHTKIWRKAISKTKLKFPFLTSPPVLPGSNVLTHLPLVPNICSSELGHHYTSAQWSWRGVCWFHLVRLSICGQKRVRSVSSTILDGSISCLHTLSSNFRRCVTCKDFFQNSKIWSNFVFVLFWLGSNMNWSVIWDWDPIWTGQ